MSWDQVFELIKGILLTQTGIPHFAVKELIMMAIAFLFLYLAVAKEYEPLLLVPIGFGIFLVNFPLAPMMGFGEHGTPELLRFFYKYGVQWEIIPCVIFLGLGAMTDFGPMIANPKTLIVGAGAQLGVFITYMGTLFFGFTLKEAASVAIIGGADGPTTIYLTTKLAPHLLGANALAAYSYMAMVPLIQPPIMRLMTTKAQRRIRMRQFRHVSAREKLLFPLIASVFIILLIPPVAPLMGMFMFGNFMRECGVVKRLSETAQNALDEYCYHLSGSLCRGNHAGGCVSDLEAPAYLRLWSVGFCYLYIRRYSDSSYYEYLSERKDESAHRISRSLCGADVCAGYSGRGSQRRSRQLADYARNGTQSCRSYRLGCCCGYVYCNVSIRRGDE